MNNILPTWLSDELKVEDLAVLEQTVIEAEKQTGAEIVPMVVKSSTPYIKHFRWGYWALVLSGLIWANPVFWVFMFFLYHLENKIRSLLVLNRAQIEFLSSSIPKAASKSGILVFISMEEQRVVILADEGINQLVSPTIWLDEVEKLSYRIKKDKMLLGLKECIESLGKFCKPLVPRLSTDHNEISDKLVIKE